MRCALLALAACSCLRAAELPASLRPEYTELSWDSVGELAPIERDIAETWTGRRLLAETGRVRRVESIYGFTDFAAVRWLREPAPMLAFDPKRLRLMSQNDFELALVRELAKASMAIPLEIPEADMAAIQTELAFALDKARAQRAFHAALFPKLNAARKALRDKRSLKPEERAPRLPRRMDGELARAAWDLALFEREPEKFYWAVERDLHPAPAVRLADLEDLFERYGPRLEGVEDLPGTPWVRLGGRRYPAALIAAARRLVESGGMARIHEALADFEGRPAKELRARLKKWPFERP